MKYKIINSLLKMTNKLSQLQKYMKLYNRYSNNKNMEYVMLCVCFKIIFVNLYIYNVIDINDN